MRDTLRRHYMELVRLPSPSGHDEYADLDAIVLAARVTSDCIREQRGIIAASQGAID